MLSNWSIWLAVAVAAVMILAGLFVSAFVIFTAIRASIRGSATRKRRRAAARRFFTTAAVFAGLIAFGYWGNKLKDAATDG